MLTKDKTSLPEEHQLIGERLKELREEKGLSIAEVSEETKISVSNLKALEAHDYDRLPADTFTRGHLNIYGNFLGLEGPQVAAEFIAERNSNRKTGRSYKKQFQDHSLSPKKMAEPSHVPSATVALILFFIIAVSFTGFCIYSSWNPFSFLNSTTKELSSTVLGMFHPSSTPVTDLIEGDRLETHVRFLADTEVEYRIDQQVITHREFNKSQEMTWSANQSLTLTFSPPDSVQLSVNSKPYTFPEEYTGELILQLKNNDQQ